MTVPQSERDRIAAAGMYRPEFEGDACGVGIIASTDGSASRRVVTLAIDALKAVWHRGAVDADGKTGDGAGIHVELPIAFFHENIERAGHRPKPNLTAVGMIFLPRTDLAAQETCRTIVESEIIGFGYSIYGWRQVPVDVSVIGAKAMQSRPEIEQIMIAGPMPGDGAKDAFEKDLYLIRRRIEKAVIAAQIQSFYVCSLSCRSVIYKGLFLAESLADFYPDLADERFVSRFAIYHPALFDQHLPAVVAGAAVPHARPQRRDQHRARQQELDEVPRDPHGGGGVRGAFGGYQAADPGRRPATPRRWTRCSRRWCARAATRRPRS